MFRPYYMSFSVPIFLFDPERMIDWHIRVLDFWAEALRPIKREVVPFPGTLLEPPTQPKVDLNDLPDGVLAISQGGG